MYYAYQSIKKRSSEDTVIQYSCACIWKAKPTFLICIARRDRRVDVATTNVVDQLSSVTAHPISYCSVSTD